MSEPLQLTFDDVPTRAEVLASRQPHVVEAVTRADDNADRAWREAAYTALCWCARHRHDGFTADDVIDRLERTGAPLTHNLAALGPVFLRGARAGVIVKAGHTVASRIRRRHRDLTVWRAAPWRG